MTDRNVYSQSRNTVSLSPNWNLCALFDRQHILTGSYIKRARPEWMTVYDRKETVSAWIFCHIVSLFLFSSTFFHATIKNTTSIDRTNLQCVQNNDGHCEIWSNFTFMAHPTFIFENWTLVVVVSFLCFRLQKSTKWSSKKTKYDFLLTCAMDCNKFCPRQFKRNRFSSHSQMLNIAFIDASHQKNVDDWLDFDSNWNIFDWPTPLINKIGCNRWFVFWQHYQRCAVLTIVVR